MIDAVYGPPGHRHTPTAKPTSAHEWCQWLKNGGQVTLDSYASSAAFLADAEWIRVNSKRWIVRHNWLYSHATRPAPDELHASEHRMALKREDTLLWHRPRVPGDLPPLDAKLIGSVHGHTPRMTPAEIHGPDGKPAWFIDLGRQTKSIAIHHGETGVRVLDPKAESSTSRFPSLPRADAFLTRLNRNKHR